MFFTESGRAYVRESLRNSGDGAAAAKGRSIANILELRANEKIAATIRVQSKRAGTGPKRSRHHPGTKTCISFSRPALAS